MNITRRRLIAGGGAAVAAAILTANPALAAVPLDSFAYGSSGGITVGGAPMLNFGSDWRFGPGWATGYAGVMPAASFYIRRIGVTVMGGSAGNWALIGHSSPTNGDWVTMHVPATGGVSTSWFGYDADAAPLFTVGSPAVEYLDCHVGAADSSMSVFVGVWWAPAA